MTDLPVEGLVPEKPAGQKGCLFWGCLSMVLIGLLFGGCVGGGFFFLRAKFSEPIARPVPVYPIQAGEYEAVERRLAEFGAAAEQDAPAVVALSADDLNAYLLGSNKEEFQGKIFVRIEKDLLFLDASIPLEGIPFCSGRFLNGSVGVRPAIVAERAFLFLESATVNGEEVPEALLEGFREKNLLERQHDPRLRELVRRAKSLEVKDGKLILER